MDDFLDLHLLKYFEDQAERSEQPASEKMVEMTPDQGEMEQMDSLFHSADELLIHALEMELFEKSLGKMAGGENKKPEA